MESILCHIKPLVINSLGGGHTHTHVHTQTHAYKCSQTEAILSNQVDWHAPGLKNSYHRPKGAKLQK